MFVLLGVLASPATIRTTRSSARRLVCTAVDQVITGPYRLNAVLLVPLYYGLAVVLATVASRRLRRRPLPG